MSDIISEYNIAKSKFFSVDEEIVIDIISTYFIHKLYNNNNKDLNDTNIVNYFNKPITRRQYLNKHENKNVVYKSKNILGYINNTIEMKRVHSIFSPLHINFKLLRKNYSLLKRYKPKEFASIVKNIFNRPVEFKNFKIIKYNMEDKGKDYIVENRKLIGYLFKADNLNITYTKNNRINNIEFDLDFNDNFLSFFYACNLLSIGYNIIPERLFSILNRREKNPYILYKKLILPYYGKVKNPLKLNEIIEVLDIKSKYLYLYKQNIKKYFEVLVENKLISNFKIDNDTYKFKKLK